MRFAESMFGVVCVGVVAVCVVALLNVSSPQAIQSYNDRRVAIEMERTERALSRDAAFERLGMMLIVVGGVLGGIRLWRRGTGVPQVAQVVQPPPQIIVLAAPLLAQRPEARELTQVDGEWVVADHEERTLLPVVHRLTGD